MAFMSEYMSTRGGGEVTTFKDVVIDGLAPDGGLYVPKQVEPLTSEELQLVLGSTTYVEQFTRVTGQFIGEDVDLPTQHTLARRAYAPERFDSRYGHVTPVQQLSDGIYVQELSLGPTAAFKDMALQPLGEYWGRFLAQAGQELPILGATSGDTGSAAEAATLGIPGVKVAMMSPRVGMSPFQQAQMGELSGDNVVNLSVDGMFDDCQNLVKAIKGDPEFAHLGAVNSINWGRVAFQIPYHFAGYAQVVGGDIGREIDVVVPSGNLGNVLAGYYARKMGLPIRRLIVATNQNDVLDRLVQTGVYQRAHSTITASPSMDISAASNYERAVLDIMDGDTNKTRRYMEQFSKAGRVQFDEFDLPMNTMKRLGFESSSAGHAQTIKAIQWAYNQAGRVIDPHTAVGVSVALQQAEEGVPTLCMSTALPVKFEDTIQEALEFVPPRPERFEGLEERVADKEAAFIEVPADINVVKAVLRSRGFART